MEGVIAAPDRDKLGERTKYTSRDPKRLFSGLRTQRLKTKKKDSFSRQHAAVGHKVLKPCWLTR